MWISIIIKIIELLYKRCGNETENLQITIWTLRGNTLWNLNIRPLLAPQWCWGMYNARPWLTESISIIYLIFIYRENECEYKMPGIIIIIRTGIIL